jgi:hypothetical protein
LVLSVNSTLQLQAHKLRERFESSFPFPHLVVEKLFDPDLVQGLVSSFPAFNPENARNELGEVGQKAVVQDLPNISPAYRQLDRMIASKEWLQFLGLATGIPGLLYDPDYVGGGTHENRTGQELDYHVDFNYHPAKKWHRRLNLILFLNSQWDEEWGGNLQLHHDAWSDTGQPDVQVVPRLGRCVIFETSERSWHGFQRVQLPAAGSVTSRRSVALYFYTEDRPADEIKAEHATFYVGRPLPREIQEGRRLTGDDLSQIQSLFNMRDQWVQFLYERELTWSSELGRIREQLHASQEATDRYEWTNPPGKEVGLIGPNGEFLPILTTAQKQGLHGAVDVVRGLPSGDTLLGGWALDSANTEAPRAIAVFSGERFDPVAAGFELVERPFPESRADLGLARHWKVGVKVTLPGSADTYSDKGLYVFAVFRMFAMRLPHAAGDPEKLAASWPVE